MAPIHLLAAAANQLARATLWSLLLAGLAHAQVPDSSSDIVLVANPDVATTELNQDSARAMFAMRLRNWPDGEAVTIFVLPNRHPVHARFTKELLSVYPHQLQLAWDRVVFSGMGQAPHRVHNQREMRNRVASTPGALGYLEREHLDESVRFIQVE